MQPGSVGPSKRSATGLVFVALVLVGAGRALSAEAPPAVPAPPPSAVAPQTDSQREAQVLLDRMTRHLASLSSFSVQFRDGYDVVQPTGQKIEFGETRRMTVARPDRLRVEEVASDGEHDVAIFDGKTISVLDSDEGVYAQAAQPGSVDEALVYYVRSLRLRMPLALLLTRNLPDVLTGRIRSLDYVEHTDILGLPAHHIAGRGETVDFQFWIRDSPEPLPMRVVITYRNAQGQPQFWANFSDWSARPAISPTTFVFAPPKGARKIPFAVQVRGSPPPAPPSGAGDKESQP